MTDHRVSDDAWYLGIALATGFASLALPLAIVSGTTPAVMFLPLVAPIMAYLGDHLAEEVDEPEPEPTPTPATDGGDRRAEV